MYHISKWKLWAWKCYSAVGISISDNYWTRYALETISFYERDSKCVLKAQIFSS